MSKEVTYTQSRTPLTDIHPQSPAAAFERFVELVRNSSAVFDADPDALLGLLRPFLANPNRDDAHVREIVMAYGAARMNRQMRKSFPFKVSFWLLTRCGRFRNRMEQFAPQFIKRLRELERTLISELRPGSITLHLKPIRYLDTPAGFGPQRLHRYRFQVQTFIESTPDDALQAVTVELTAKGEDADVVVDEINPQASFSAVGLKRSAGVQVGHQETSTEKQSAGAEIAGAGAKVSTILESTSSEQRSALFTIGGEQTVARTEQYLIARKIGNRAVWRTLAGVGPVDAGGSEYTADLLIPQNIREVDIRVEARVEWLRVGTVPAEVRQTAVLPAPSGQPSLLVEAP